MHFLIWKYFRIVMKSVRLVFTSGRLDVVHPGSCIFLIKIIAYYLNVTYYEHSRNLF